MFQLLLITLIFTQAYAFETFDVDWPERKPNEKHHILAITIDNCETRFNIKDKDFYSFTKKEKAIAQAMEKAIQRAKNNCED